MRLTRFQAILASGAVAAVMCIAVPASASATTLWVSPATPSAPYNSCAHPSYSTVQGAINGPGTTIHVCPGTYVEQLQIERPVTITAPETGATVKLPSTPVDSSTSCDTAIHAPYQPNQDAVSICTSGTVSISGLKIEAIWPTGTCYGSMYGIFVAGGGTLKATKVTVDGAGPSPIDGCQGGVGIEVGTARTEPAEVGHATLSGDTVSGYQKNGITDEGDGTSINVISTTVTGAGPTTEIAQNGIQVSYGASGKIAKSEITGNECDVASACGENSQTETQSTGVLFFGAAAGSHVTASKINGNDIGVYTEDTEASAPAASQISITGDTLEADRYEAVLISQGWATVNHDTISNGNVGIQLLQYAEQTYGPKGTGSDDTISGMSKWAVQGYSDNEPGDKFGTFTIRGSAISGNPGPTVAESVNTNNPEKLTIITERDT